MMYVLMSDSHGNINNVKNIIEYTNKNWNIDFYIHLGDGASDILYCINNGIVKKEKCILVKGNCDFLSNIKDEIYLKNEKEIIFLTHGHKYGVKSGLDTIATRAKANKANLVLYGHTHNEYIGESEGITFINPGSCKYESKFALLEVNDGKHYATLMS